MNKLRVAVEDLKVGMYVAELDRAWIGTPFPFQGFRVANARQIEEIRTYCKAVFVDLDQQPPEDIALRHSAAPAAPLRGTTSYRTDIAVEAEIPRAKEVYQKCVAAIVGAIQRLRTSDGIDAKAVTSAVKDLADSVQRNPDAVALLSQLQRKGEPELIRALDTSVLMLTFARFLQLSRQELELVGLAGMLLDVGKIRVPDAILRKPGILSPQEYEVVKRHVEHSVEIVRARQEFPPAVAEIILMHHEREDGTGYPRGLKGGEISLYGAMAGIVDSYSALVSARPYAQQLSPSNALGTLYRQRGTLFQEALAEQFIQCIGIYPVGSLVELNTGEFAIVIAQNVVRRLQPRVMVILDRDRHPVVPQKILDLINSPRATADEPYRIRRTMAPGSLPIDVREFFL